MVRPRPSLIRRGPAVLAAVALFVAAAGGLFALANVDGASTTLSPRDIAWPLLAVALILGGQSVVLFVVWYTAEHWRQRQTLILAQLGEGILLVDPATERILETNPAVPRLLGYDARALASMRLSDFVVPEQRPGADGTGARRVLRTPQPVNATWCCRHKDGTVTELRVRARLMADRPPSAWCITLSDPAEELRLQSMLRSAQSRFRVLFERSAIGIALIDLQGRATVTNPALQTMLGYSAEELRGIDFISATHPDSHRDGPELWRDLAAGRRDRYETERSYVHKTGPPVWVRLLVSLVRGGPGDPEFAICMVEDITQRRRDGEKLEHRARELAALYETSLAINAQPNVPALLETIVQRAAELLGAHMGGLYLLRPEAQMLEMVVSHNLPGTPPGTLMRMGEGMAGRVAQSGEPVMDYDDSRREIRLRAMDGGMLRRVIGVPLRLGAYVIGVLTITDDRQTNRFSTDDVRLLELFADQAAIAVENARLYEAAQHELVERKRAESALRQSMTELEARNEELDAFTHTVAHDLQNPLGTLIGFSTALDAEYSHLSEGEMRGYLAMIGQTSRKMSNIVRELLLLAGVRKTDVSRTSLDMAAIVAEARERLVYMIREHNAQVHVPAVWPRALGYGPWVEEIWVNYLSNALKYGGRPPVIELGATPLPDGRVRYWVRDNGRGLTAEERAALFTPFVRVTQLHITGHGLGLSIVKRIAEKLDGEVGVESDLGRGSVFSFTLPGS